MGPITGPALDRPQRPSARIFGAGAEPVTRIGQENAAIRERNRAVEAARARTPVHRDRDTSEASRRQQEAEREQ